MLLLVCSSAVAQKPDAATLSVEGYAQIDVEPDIGALNLSISSVQLNVPQAIDSIRAKSKKIQSLIESAGFSADDLRTESFSVRTNSVRREGEYVDSGYVALQSLKVKFAYTPETLSRVIQRLTSGDSDYSFYFNFDISDSLRTDVQSRILELATQSAVKRAEVLATSAAVRLGRIKDIRYNGFVGSQGMALLREFYGDYSAVAESAYDDESYSFKPSDLSFIDNVTIVYEILK